MEWLAPWHAIVDDPAQSTGLEERLRRELCPGHELHAVSVRAIGCRPDNGDVLFSVEDDSNRVAVVHLTWTTSPPERPPLPLTTLYSNFQAWAAEGMARDAWLLARKRGEVTGDPPAPQMHVFLGRCVTALKRAGIRAKGTRAFTILVGPRQSALDLDRFLTLMDDASVFDLVVQEARSLLNQVQRTRNDTFFDTYLCALDACSDLQGVLGEEYVIHPPNRDHGYQQTPRNAVTFANMGVDGVHYALLMSRGRVRDDSPVIQICPMDGDCYQVLSESFVGFLAEACGVTLQEMEAVFTAERSGEHILAAFLKARCDMRRLWLNGDRPEQLKRFLEWIEPKE